MASKLGMQFPRANEAAVQRLRAGQTIQAQQLAGAVASGAVPKPQGAQLDQAGAQLAQQTAQKATQQAAQTGQQMTQAAQLGEQAAANAGNIAAGQRAAGMAETARSNEDQLARLSLGVKKKLFDDRTKFETDEIGRTTLNSIQLADWAVVSAESAEDFKDKMQTIELAQDRKIELLKTGYSRIMAALDAEAKGTAQKMTQEAKQRMIEAQRAMKEAIRREQANKANNQMIFSTAVGIAGGVAGGIYGGPMGAAAGYSAGSGLGSAGYAAANQ